MTTCAEALRIYCHDSIVCNVHYEEYKRQFLESVRKTLPLSPDQEHRASGQSAGNPAKRPGGREVI